MENLQYIVIASFPGKDPETGKEKTYRPGEFISILIGKFEPYPDWLTDAINKGQVIKL